MFSHIILIKDVLYLFFYLTLGYVLMVIVVGEARMVRSNTPSAGMPKTEPQIKSMTTLNIAFGPNLECKPLTSIFGYDTSTLDQYTIDVLGRALYVV